ncbi:MAG TPA: COX15/CtaA family protein [Candidatus Eisenbacteria bacterium]|nr:COX15/CtaA family protein [Candidatus Eisenbacteria bacterium]
MKPTLLHRYATFVTAMTGILIFAGGLVTSTNSGLSVPDWPLSYGTAFPPMIGGIRFEHTHRLIAGTVGVLTLVLAIAVWRAESRRWMKGLGLAALLAVVAQAVLGGLTVIYLLPAWISVTHACLAQTFFSLVASIALFTSNEWREGRVEPCEYAGSLRRLLITTTAFAWLQLVAGAIVRHTGRGLRWHFALAFLIALHILFIVLKSARDKSTRERLFPHAVLLGGLVTTQIFLGFGSFIFTRMLKAEIPTTGEVLFTTAHQTLGAMILAGTALLALRSYRLLAAPPSASRSAVPARGSLV